MGKIILVNGPPSSGKDTAAKALMAHGALGSHRVLMDRLSMPIKRAFAGMMQSNIDQYGNVFPYESEKEKIIPMLGKSYRQWQIDFSEKFMKPNYGEAVFGELLVKRINRRFQKNISDIIVIPDAGFEIEVKTLYREYAPKDILLIRCFREGFTFNKDSRSYISAPTMPGAAQADIENNNTVDDFAEKVIATVKVWLGNK